MRAAMPVAALLLVMAPGSLGQAGQCFPSMTEAQYAEAEANWEAVMEAHRQKKAQHLPTGGSCTSDIRTTFPACLQYETDWCWATGVAELASFWDKNKYPEVGSDCHGIECQIVGHKTGQDCCANRNKTECSLVGGNEQDILDGIKFTVGKAYTAKGDGPLSQADLDKVLSKGHPVIIAVFWTAGGGHALTLGGCAGSGSYYLHDPENKQGSYQTLTYEQIASYKPPEAKTLTGKWMWTFYLQGDDSVATMEDILV